MSRRVLPGDLVSFYAPPPGDNLPQVQVIEHRATPRKKKAPGFPLLIDNDDFNRLGELQKEMDAINPNHLYLVLTASETRSFLMRCGTCKYVVAFNKDLVNHSDEEEEDPWL
jgi:hypothetical protein